jgi:pyruvate/2-oxoglutarate dehydrogenase complex dihydrolipoamide dehydrogenase (E3) component
MKYDVIVIGAGSGGLNVASFANRVGLRVLLVDKSDSHIGGDCLNTGCVPSKALIHVARLCRSAKHAEAFGVTTTGHADWSKVKAYILEKQAVIRVHEDAAWFRSKGIDVVLGEAQFASPHSITVCGVEYEGSKIVLATGSRPRMLMGQGVEQVAQVLTNENFFAMDTLPDRILFIGGGPIGIELAQASRALGSHVTVVDQGSAILAREDSDMSRVLMEVMKKEGVEFVMEHSLKVFDSPHSAVMVDASGAETRIEFDAVFLGIGRQVHTEGLQLEKAGIRMNARGGILVNEHLATTNPRVLLCGDVAGGHQFTHVAEMHAGVILRNFFSPIRTSYSARHIAWTTYTEPELASFGRSAPELAREGVTFQVIETEFTEDDRAIVDDYQNAKAKLFVDTSGRILGGTMVAPHAGELVQELILAMHLGTPIPKLFSKVYPYPTATRINKRTMAEYMGASLTDTKRSFLRSLFYLKTMFS